MKIFSWNTVGICGEKEGSPLRIARARTTTVLPTEKEHTHANVYEYYIVIKGALELSVDHKIIIVRENEILMVAPGEHHRIQRVIEETDYFTVKQDENTKRNY